MNDWGKGQYPPPEPGTTICTSAENLYRGILMDVRFSHLFEVTEGDKLHNVAENRLSFG